MKDSELGGLQHKSSRAPPVTGMAIIRRSEAHPAEIGVFCSESLEHAMIQKYPKI